MESKSTDPMTGEILKVKALFPDDEMKLRCAEYVMSLKPPVIRSCGRGRRARTEGAEGAAVAAGGAARGSLCNLKWKTRHTR